MTEPVYWTDPKKSTFEVTIAGVESVDGRVHIAVLEDVVRPASGGQAGDRGEVSIGSEKFTFSGCVRDRGSLFLVAEKGPSEAGRATLTLDIEWRTAMMRNHTGEHLFAKALTDLLGDVTLGRIWIDGNHGSVEVLSSNVTLDALFNAERTVNEIIARCLPVNSRVVKASEIDKEVRAREGVTSKHDRLRIVEVEGFDKSACSGIHVTNTEEILVFKIIDYGIESDRAHVEFITGSRAVQQLSDIYNEVLRRKTTYPFQVEQIGAVLDKSKEIREGFEAMRDKLLETLTRNPAYDTIGGVRFRAEILPGFDTHLMKRFVKESKMKGPTVLLLFSPGDKCQVMLRTNEMPEEARYYIEDGMRAHGGVGGGRGEVFTCGFTGVEDPQVLFENLKTHIVNKISA